MKTGEGGVKTGEGGVITGEEVVVEGDLKSGEVWGSMNFVARA